MSYATFIIAAFIFGFGEYLIDLTEGQTFQYVVDLLLVSIYLAIIEKNK